MQPDLLQQLRDIHLPAAPGWWPPAPGWWVLAALLAAGLAFLAYLTWQAIRRRRPIRAAQRCYEGVFGAWQRHEIDAATYLHQTNELLKRLFIHGLQDDGARPLSDGDWLTYLDTHGGGNGFRQGPGRQLGNQRFQPRPEADPDTLHPLVRRVFRNAGLHRNAGLPRNAGS